MKCALGCWYRLFGKSKDFGAMELRCGSFEVWSREADKDIKVTSVYSL